MGIIENKKYSKITKNKRIHVILKTLSIMHHCVRIKGQLCDPMLQDIALRYIHVKKGAQQGTSM